MALRSPANARAFHLVTFLVAAGAVVLQLVLIIQGGQHLDTAPGVARANDPDLSTRLVGFVSYLTIWFNVLVAGTSAVLAADAQRDGGRGCRGVRREARGLAVGGGVVDG